MEHENLLGGFSLERAIYNDHINTKVIYQLNLNNKSIKIDINELFTMSQEEIFNMNNKITDYVNESLETLNLRECCLFLNAFYRKFKNKNFTQMFPEETIKEIKMYDKIIEDLNNS